MTRTPVTAVTIESPCIGVCTLDEQHQCTGCLRYAEEIVGWLSMSGPERRRIMEELPRRRGSGSDV